ncbi:MAG: 5'-deoxynucleotidase [Eubacteriales bacterium]|jgi:5'-deoxynucleotidase
MRFDFFALLSRMKYVTRWGLMRSTVREDIAQHSYDVAVLAHALALIHNRLYGGQIDAQRCAAMALYHDCSEILTGDLPTPVKYCNQRIVSAYKQVEEGANRQLLSMLPPALQLDYEPFFLPREEDALLWKLVKAADKLSAHIKCLEETRMSNPEFAQALTSTRHLLEELSLPEVDYFMSHFLESYGLSLDELRT